MIKNLQIDLTAWFDAAETDHVIHWLYLNPKGYFGNYLSWMASCETQQACHRVATSWTHCPRCCYSVTHCWPNSCCGRRGAKTGKWQQNKWFHIVTVTTRNADPCNVTNIGIGLGPCLKNTSKSFALRRQKNLWLAIWQKLLVDKAPGTVENARINTWIKIFHPPVLSADPDFPPPPNPRSKHFSQRKRQKQLLYLQSIQDGFFFVIISSGWHSKDPTFH